MIVDKFNQYIYSESELVELYLKDPELILKEVLVDTAITIDPNLELENAPKLIHYIHTDRTISEFDKDNQNTWFMPEEYKTLDIAKFILDQCKSDEELQRVGEELILYQEREMFDLLRYCKYFVDTLRKHNIVWGVGRGSSVASYCLFLLGIHRINSIYYELEISEFLK